MEATPDIVWHVMLKSRILMGPSQTVLIKLEFGLKKILVITVVVKSQEVLLLQILGKLAKLSEECAVQQKQQRIHVIVKKANAQRDNIVPMENVSQNALKVQEILSQHHALAEVSFAQKEISAMEAIAKKAHT